jgi:vacuolar protein sorting-associated protein 29
MNNPSVTAGTTSTSTSQFGELVLILGDMFIPDRAIQIPPEFQRMLIPGRMQYVFGTGNISATSLEELRLLAPHVYIVAGDYDHLDDPIHENTNYNNTNYNMGTTTTYPETCIVQVGNWKIGMIHGHQLIPPLPFHSPTTTTMNNNGVGTESSSSSLDWIQRKLQADIVITGHTHRSTVTLHHNYCHINPVSV